MSIASAAGNIYFAYQFLTKLTKPFKDTDAYRLGIIDEKGKVLKRRSTLKTREEKEAYTVSDTLVFNLKKLLIDLHFINEKGSSDRELPLPKSNITRCKSNIRFNHLTVVNKYVN